MASFIFSVNQLSQQQNFKRNIRQCVAIRELPEYTDAKQIVKQNAKTKTEKLISQCVTAKVVSTRLENFAGRLAMIGMPAIVINELANHNCTFESLSDLTQQDATSALLGCVTIALAVGSVLRALHMRSIQQDVAQTMSGSHADSPASSYIDSVLAEACSKEELFNNESEWKHI